METFIQLISPILNGQVPHGTGPRYVVLWQNQGRVVFYSY